MTTNKKRRTEKNWLAHPWEYPVPPPSDGTRMYGYMYPPYSY